jgi:hypothetical protein
MLGSRGPLLGVGHTAEAFDLLVERIEHGPELYLSDPGERPDVFDLGGH